MSRAKALAVLVPAALALFAAVGVAIADTSPAVTITNPRPGQNISRARDQYFVAAGKSSFATPAQTTARYYLRRDGCGTSSDNPHLSIVNGTDAGDGCGLTVAIVGLGGNADANAFVDYPASDGLPVTLDGSQAITGTLDLEDFGLVNGLGAGVGQVTADISMEALVNGQGVPLGSDSESVLITPAAADYPVSFHITPNAQLDKVDLSGIDLRVHFSGPYAFSGFVGNSGKSWVSIPAWAASLNRSVLLSVDDPTFASPTSTTIDSSYANWYTAVPTPQTLGKHTLYVEAIQGFNTSSITTRTFNVTK